MHRNTDGMWGAGYAKKSKVAPRQTKAVNRVRVNAAALVLVPRSSFLALSHTQLNARFSLHGSFHWRKLLRS